MLCLEARTVASRAGESDRQLVVGALSPSPSSRRATALCILRGGRLVVLVSIIGSFFYWKLYVNFLLWSCSRVYLHLYTSRIYSILSSQHGYMLRPDQSEQYIPMVIVIDSEVAI